MEAFLAPSVETFASLFEPRLDERGGHSPTRPAGQVPYHRQGSTSQTALML